MYIKFDGSNSHSPVQTADVNWLTVLDSQESDGTSNTGLNINNNFSSVTPKTKTGYRTLRDFNEEYTITICEFKVKDNQFFGNSLIWRLP